MGETKRRVHDRLSEHVRDIKSKRDTPVAKHFNLPYHNSTHIRIQVLEYIKLNRTKYSTTTYHIVRETYWIHQLKLTVSLCSEDTHSNIALTPHDDLNTTLT